MRKFLVIVLSILAMLCAVGLMACDNNEHTHSFTESTVKPTCTAGGYILHKCECGEEYITDETAALEHDYKWTTTKEPTETKTGEMRGTCKNCGDVTTKTIPTLNHKHNYTSKTIAPTCTEKGYTIYKCSCGNEYKDNYVNAKGHKYSTKTVPPTCTEQGYTTYTCSECKNTYNSDYTQKKGHNFVKSGEPTGDCPLTMVQNYKCNNCKQTKTESVVAQAPDSHNKLQIGDACKYCGWSVYTKNGDSVLMKNGKDELSAEFYGTETYEFQSVKSHIVNAYISNNIKSIRNNTFKDYSNLTNLTIPNSVTSIGYRAFYGCNRLTSITILDSVTSIGGGAFQDCSSLTSITIPGRVTSIGDSAFYGCSSLTSITIPGSVTSIGSEAFYGCNKIISTENGLNYVRDILIGVATTGGLSPTYYNIKNGTKLIADKAFYNNNNILRIDIPDSVTSIGGAFWGCSSLTSVTIPDSVTSIGDRAFYKCSSLTSITIPDSVTSIGREVFSGCSSLTSITIPDSVTSIGVYTFYECSSLTSITIPDSVTSIEGGAFWGCSSLTSITIPDSVTSIRSDAFRDCTRLRSITIPNSVTSIGAYTFYKCSSLTSITIPDSVTSIEKYTFYGVYWTSITIPDSVTSIGDYAFNNDYKLWGTITFKGTKSQWYSIEKGVNWLYYQGSCEVDCTDGTIIIRY